MKNSGKDSEFTRGWRVLLASSLGNAAGLSGIPFYTFGVFVVPLTLAFGWTRGQVSGAASFLILGTAITAPLVGSLIDRIGARTVALWSLFALALGYFALTTIGNGVYMFYAAWLLLSLIGGGTTPVVWTRAVNMWFDRSRGLALGLTLAGSGLAGIFGPVLCNALIQSYGWQGGYFGIGAFIILVAIPVVAWLFNERATPVVAAASAHEHTTPQAPGLSFAQALRTLTYWKIAGSFILMSGAISGLIINVVPLLMDRGLTPAEAAGVASTLGIAVLTGRIGVGLLLDRVPAPLVAGLLFTITALGCLLLTIAGAPTWVLMLSVISLGLAAAAEVDLVAFLVSRYFGMKAYGKIYGSQLSTFYLGAAIGPLLIGATYDHFGNYVVVLYTVAAIIFSGAMMLGTLGRPKQIVAADATPLPA